MQRLPAFLAALALAAATALAQSGPGAITGRVFNPASGEYVRNAQVRLEGTEVSAISEAGGEFRLFPVPAGQATVVVSYTGYRTATATLTVGLPLTEKARLNESLTPVEKTPCRPVCGKLVVTCTSKGVAIHPFCEFKFPRVNGGTSEVSNPVT